MGADADPGDLPPLRVRAPSGEAVLLTMTQS